LVKRKRSLTIVDRCKHTATCLAIVRTDVLLQASGGYTASVSRDKSVGIDALALKEEDFAANGRHSWLLDTNAGCNSHKGEQDVEIEKFIFT
jgi:hypothetical protein